MPRSGDDPRDKALDEAITAQVYRGLHKTLGIPQLPQGSVTILFTDVEGSTDLVRELGDRKARDILRKHDEVVQKAINGHGGTEVERAGDSFMAAFSTARQAVACGMEIQDTLAARRAKGAEAQIHVRIGMDTGEIIAEENRYFGSTVFRAARIADLAPAGRILVSEATKVLASQAGFEFEDLGEHELKGLGPGHRLFEVTTGPESPS